MIPPSSEPGARMRRFLVDQSRRQGLGSTGVRAVRHAAARTSARDRESGRGRSYVAGWLIRLFRLFRAPCWEFLRFCVFAYAPFERGVPRLTSPSTRVFPPARPRTPASL